MNPCICERASNGIFKELLHKQLWMVHRLKIVEYCPGHYQLGDASNGIFKELLHKQLWMVHRLKIVEYCPGHYQLGDHLSSILVRVTTSLLKIHTLQ